jgi:hypothetical protein
MCKWLEKVQLASNTKKSTSYLINKTNLTPVLPENRSKKLLLPLKIIHHEQRTRFEVY